jgi:hypothetical protein
VVQSIGNFDGVKAGYHSGKISACLIRKGVGEPGSRFGGSPALGNFAIQDPERVCLDATPTISAEPVHLPCQISNQQRPIGFPVSGVTKVIDLQGQGRKVQIGKNSP